MELVKPPYGYCDYDPNSMPAPYREAIGLVSIAWGNLEQAVDDALRLLAQIDVRTAAIMLTHASMPQRLDQLASLAAERFVPDNGVTEVKQMRSRVEALSGKRNDFVHCKWFVQQSTGRVLMQKVKAKGELKTEVRHYLASEIAQVAADAHALSTDVFNFFENVRRINGLPDETMDE